MSRSAKDYRYIKQMTIMYDALGHEDMLLLMSDMFTEMYEENYDNLGPVHDKVSDGLADLAEDIEDIR